MPAPVPEIIDVDAGKITVTVIVPASVYYSRTGHVYELPLVYVPECTCVPVAEHKPPILPVNVPRCVCQYRCRYRYRYDIDTGTVHFGKFGDARYDRGAYRFFFQVPEFGGLRPLPKPDLGEGKKLPPDGKAHGVST